MSIFKSYTQDFIFLYLPSILAVLALEFSPQTVESLFFYVVVFFLLDIGHVFTTWWRTVLNETERNRTHLTWTVPISLTLISLLWWYLRIPFYWPVVAYLTIFHNLRQGWGVIRWYEKINKKMTNNSIFYYGLTILPVIIFHFRTVTFEVSFYANKDLFLSTDPTNSFYPIFLALYLFCLLTWIAKELFYIIKSKQIELNRIVAMSFFAGVYAYSFILSKNLAQVLSLLIISHSCTYVFIMGRYLKTKTWSKLKIISNLSILLIVGGILSYYLEEYWLGDVFEYTTSNPDPWDFLLTLLYIIPVVSHFIWDFYLWKRSHPETQELYE